MVSLLSAVRDIGRLREIYMVLVRHGFADVAERLGSGPKIVVAGVAATEVVAASPSPWWPRSGITASSSASALPGRAHALVVMGSGPSFVKLGQIASTRPDLLPEDWIIELKKLQTR